MRCSLLVRYSPEVVAIAWNSHQEIERLLSSVYSVQINLQKIRSSICNLSNFFDSLEFSLQMLNRQVVKSETATIKVCI